MGNAIQKNISLSSENWLLPLCIHLFFIYTDISAIFALFYNLGNLNQLKKELIPSFASNFRPHLSFTQITQQKEW